MEDIVKVLLKYKYVKKEFGYILVTKSSTHWVTLLFNGSIQIYAYLTEYEDFEKIYDTGVINISSENLEIFIKVLTSEHI